MTLHICYMFVFTITMFTLFKQYTYYQQIENVPSNDIVPRTVGDERGNDELKKSYLKVNHVCYCEAGKISA